MVNPKEQWCSNERLIEAWLRTTGDEEHQYGDYWRMMLVNPIVLTVASLMARNLSAGTTQLDRAPIDFGIAVQRAALQPVSDLSLMRWHESVAKDHDLSPLRILDLGCGEGYMGRWLNSMGATYVGVDVSPTLVKTGNQRAKGAPNSDRFMLSTLDLEGDVISSRSLRSILDPLPHLVTGVIVLEHLEDPVPLLRQLSQTLDHEKCKGIFFTLNPNYLNVDHSGGDVQHIKARIASADQEVDCIIRSLRAMHQIFRDSHLRIIHESPLTFPRSHRVTQEPSEFRGIPPFYAFLVSPRPAPASLKREELRSVLTTGFWGQVDDRSRSILEKRRDELSLLSFAPKEIILPQNNLGGNLLSIVAGSADLWVDGKLAGAYGSGELLGDLETGQSDSGVSHFLYPIVAGAQGARVLQIPAIVARELMDFPASMAASLFNQLRRRLVIALWNFNFRKRSSDKSITLPDDLRTMLDLKPDQESVMFDRTYADKVARTLLASCDIERLSGLREPEGQGVFLPDDKIAERAQINTTSGAPVLEAIRLFTSLGILDCFPGHFLRSHFRSLYEECWELVKAEAVDAILNEAHSRAGLKKAWPEVRRLALGGGAFGYKALGPHREMTTAQSWTRAVRDFIEDLLRLSLGSSSPGEWQDAIRQYITFMGRVNRFWREKAPCYFVIHDPWLLRAFVLEDDTSLEARITARSLVASPDLLGSRRVKTFSDLAALIAENEPGRGRLFVRRLGRFFLADLKSDRMVNFSGSQEGYVLPPWP